MKAPNKYWLPPPHHDFSQTERDAILKSKSPSLPLLGRRWGDTEQTRVWPHPLSHTSSQALQKFNPVLGQNQDTKSLLCVMGPCSPGDGWILVCPWETVTKFLVLLSSCTWFLLFLLNCLYLTPWVLLFWFSTQFCNGVVGEQLPRAWLMAGVTPQHRENKSTHQLMLQRLIRP